MRLFEVSLDPSSALDDLQAAHCVLATLIFDAQSPGVSALGLSILSLGDADGGPLIADVLAGSITVQSTDAVGWPRAPASLLLLFSGLAGFASAQRRRTLSS